MSIDYRNATNRHPTAAVRRRRVSRRANRSAPRRRRRRNATDGRSTPTLRRCRRPNRPIRRAVRPIFRRCRTTETTRRRWRRRRWRRWRRWRRTGGARRASIAWAAAWASRRACARRSAPIRGSVRTRRGARWRWRWRRWRRWPMTERPILIPPIWVCWKWLYQFLISLHLI